MMKVKPIELLAVKENLDQTANDLWKTLRDMGGGVDSGVLTMELAKIIHKINELTESINKLAESQLCRDNKGVGTIHNFKCPC